jgi:hypothetical protein
MREKVEFKYHANHQHTATTTRNEILLHLFRCDSTEY